MKVGAGGASGVAAYCDALALFHILPGPDHDPGKVGVERLPSAGMGNDHGLAVTAQPSGVGDLAVL